MSSPGLWEGSLEWLWLGEERTDKQWGEGRELLVVQLGLVDRDRGVGDRDSDSAAVTRMRTFDGYERGNASVPFGESTGTNRDEPGKGLPLKYVFKIHRPSISEWQIIILIALRENSHVEWICGPNVHGKRLESLWQQHEHQLPLPAPRVFN